MDAGSYWASFPAPVSHLPLAKTTELCKTLFHSCRLPFPSEFAHFLFQFLIKLKQKAAKKRGKMLITQRLPLSITLSLSFCLSPLFARSSLSVSSSFLWAGLELRQQPVESFTSRGSRGEKRQLLVLHARMENCCNTRGKSKPDFQSLLIFYLIDEASPPVHAGTKMFSCSLTSEMITEDETLKKETVEEIVVEWDEPAIASMRRTNFNHLFVRRMRPWHFMTIPAQYRWRKRGNIQKYHKDFVFLCSPG